MGNPPDVESSVIGSRVPGSSIVSIHTERKVRIFAVYEPELDTLSYLSAATTGLCGLGALFVPYFLDNIKKSAAGYSCFTDPFGWGALGLFFAAGIAIFIRKGISGKIKADSINR